MTSPATVRSHVSQAAWSFGARGTAAAAQMVTIVILARGLSPSSFAQAVVIQTVLTAVATVNGFGLTRKLIFVRSRNPGDPYQATICAQILLYTYLSAVGLVVVVVAWAILAADLRLLIVLPTCVWLFCEQVTQVWNAISITDGRAGQLVGSYLARRVPVIVALLISSMTGGDMLLALTIGMALGGLISLAAGYRAAPSWARQLTVRRTNLDNMRGSADLGVWFAELGDQVRDLDTVVLAAVSPLTAGLYAFPARVVRPMGMISLAVASVIFPVFARRERVSGRHVALSAVAGALPTVGLAGLIFALAPLVPTLVGPNFEDSVPVLRIMCVTTALWAPSTILISFMQSRRSESGVRFGLLLVAANLVLVAVVVVCGISGGPQDAAIGAAITQGLIMVLIAISVTFETRPHIESVESRLGDDLPHNKYRSAGEHS